MPTVNVNIQPEIISWALSQTQKEKLGDKLMNNIVQWLNGTKTPTFNQIEDFLLRSTENGCYGIISADEGCLKITDLKTIKLT